MSTETNPERGRRMSRREAGRRTGLTLLDTMVVAGTAGALSGWMGRLNERYHYLDLPHADGIYYDSRSADKGKTQLVDLYIVGAENEQPVKRESHITITPQDFSFKRNEPETLREFSPPENLRVTIHNETPQGCLNHISIINLPESETSMEIRLVGRHRDAVADEKLYPDISYVDLSSARHNVEIKDGGARGERSIELTGLSKIRVGRATSAEHNSYIKTDGQTMVMTDLGNGVRIMSPDPRKHIALASYMGVPCLFPTLPEGKPPKTGRGVE